ncbi:MAG: phasin family protein [Candidatus Dormibacteraeota bacterium]|nr:phasin family protein [Candidatus Dormibacteraeota bacterium]
MVTEHLIKKYANRKLYDTSTSRYVTLDRISALVREGAGIKVVDRDTGRDLTSLVLSQIVMGEEKRQPNNGGETLHERGQALLGYVRRTLRAPASAVSSEVERRLDEAEDLVDAAVARALSRLSIPTRRDYELLETRLDRLAARLDALQPNAPTQPVRATRTRSGGARR